MLEAGDVWLLGQLLTLAVLDQGFKKLGIWTWQGRLHNRTMGYSLGWKGLELSSLTCSKQGHLWGQTGLLMFLFGQVLKTSECGDGIASLGNLPRCLTVFMEKEFFLLFSLKLSLLFTPAAHYVPTHTSVNICPISSMSHRPQGAVRSSKAMSTPSCSSCGPATLLCRAVLQPHHLSDLLQAPLVCWPL